MSQSDRDEIFSRLLSKVGDFAFDKAVVDVFPDMIQRSIPGYATVITMSGQIARSYARPHTKLYDLGCSLGATSLAMASNVSTSHCKVIAVDNSPAMLARLGSILAEQATKIPIEVVCADIEDTDIDTASVVAMNYTLQFVEPKHRHETLTKICRGMIGGGVLILSEKICFPDRDVDERFTRLYHDFKRANGYSDLEISQKRDALENVLIPETLDAHKRRLRDAGFSRIETWFQCFNFASILAFK